MKMNYLQKNSKKTIRQKLIWACIIFFILTGIRFFFSHPFSSAAYTIAKPIWQLRDNIFGPPDTQSANGTVQALQSQIYALQLKNIELSATISTLSDKLPVAITQNSKGRVLAKVLSKPPYSPFDVFILSLGSQNGIVLGAKVFIGDNTLIGTITKVEPGYSEATLLSSGTSSFDAHILRTGESLLVSGNGGGTFVITLPKDFDILAGDVLVDGTPNQHVITQVYSIDTSSGGSFKKVYARIPVNVFESEWVGVEK